MIGIDILGAAVAADETWAHFRNSSSLGDLLFHLIGLGFSVIWGCDVGAAIPAAAEAAVAAEVPGPKMPPAVAAKTAAEVPKMPPAVAAKTAPEVPSLKMPQQAARRLGQVFILRMKVQYSPNFASKASEASAGYSGASTAVPASSRGV